MYATIIVCEGTEHHHILNIEQQIARRTSLTSVSQSQIHLSYGSLGRSLGSLCSPLWAHWPTPLPPNTADDDR
jgi:hypothetical protein